MRRPTAAVLTLLFLIISLQLQALAVPLGSIQITLKGGSSPIRGAQIQICRAGEPVTGGYRLTEEFGGGFVSDVDILSPELAEFLSGESYTGLTRKTDREGNAKFTDLEEGLYLVTQTASAGGYRPFEPFVITLPWDGTMWDITATPKTEREITPMPDTSDPGTLDRGFWGMLLSGLGLTFMLIKRRKWVG